jgi:hypothetical protein
MVECTFRINLFGDVNVAHLFYKSSQFDRQASHNVFLSGTEGVRQSPSMVRFIQFKNSHFGHVGY